MNIFRIIIISIVILVIFYIYQMTTLINNELYTNNLSNCLIINKLDNNYSIEENINTLYKEQELTQESIYEDDCIEYEDFSNIQNNIIGINNNIKFNKLYYGLECDYERAGCFYETLVNNNFKSTNNILEASLIVPCTYETTEQELNDLRKNNIDKNIFGNSPIILATFIGSIEITKKLILNGASIHDRNNNKDTPIILASIHGYIEIIKLLLLKGANINDKNKYNRTPIMEASKNNNIQIVKVLQKWPLTMFIVILQELVVYHVLDCESFIDFYQYFGEII